VAVSLAAALIGAAGAGTATGATDLRSRPTATEFVPGEVLVRFRPAVGRFGRAAVLEETDMTRKRWLRLPGTELLELPQATSVAAAVRELEANPAVLYAEPNFVYHASVAPDDPRYGELWGLNQASDVDIDAPEAWDVTTGSSSVTVAVVDTGVAYNHPDLEANMVPGHDFVGDDEEPLDEHGHGTHVAGTIGAAGNNSLGVTGVNWDVSLMPVRVLNAQGNGTLDQVTEGFAYAADHGAKVVNASLGCAGCSSQAMEAVINAATGTLFVVAAGNDSTNNDAQPQYPCNYTSANLVCVAATTATDALATFSNFGAVSVDLAAPGTGILSTWPGPGYASISGTSMATPHVAGVAALLLAQDASRTPAQVRDLLLAGVDVLPQLSGKTATSGRLNACKALRGSAPACAYSAPPQPQPPPPPPPPTPPPAPPACPPAGITVGAAYRGTHAGGGTVCLAVMPGWTGVVSFLITDVPGDTCDFLWANFPFPSPLPIVGRTFTEPNVLTGSFSNDRGVQGTVVISDPTPPPCTTGPVSWTATTDGTPPWMLAPQPPAPQPPAPQPLPPPPSPRLRCVVPNVKGKTVAQARRLLASRHCALGRVTRAYSAKVKRGRIIKQSRPVGVRLARGMRINVVVSRGRRR
jgi:subtilisin family serine protease